MAAQTGTVVLNYRLEEPIGEGGFGTVYRAVHEELGRRVAVKVLHPEFARQRDVVERFFREARAACEIGHSAIVSIENYGRLDTGEPFFIMELAPGRPLSAIIDDRPLEPARAIRIFDPIVAALTAAHQRGIIHRDLKPANIMVDDAGDRLLVKLLDFGVAKLADASETLHSRTGAVLGSPLFMAPEQAENAKAADVRADVYGFAATVFACVTGRPPFIGDRLLAVMAKIQSEPAPGVRQFAPHLSSTLEAALSRCLAKDPDDRPATLGDAWQMVRAGLAESAQPEPSVARHARTMKRSPPASDTTLGSSSAELPAQRRSRIAPIAIVGLIVAVAAAISASVILPALDREGDEDRAGDETEPATTSAAPAAQPASPVSPAADGAPAAAAGAEPPIADAAPAVAETDALAPVASAPTDRRCRLATLTRAVERARTPKARARAAATLRRCLRDHAIAPGEHAALVAKLPGSDPAPESPPSEPARSPRVDCSSERFERITKGSPTENELRSALRALKACRDVGDITQAIYDRIHPILIDKLLPRDPAPR